MDTYHKGCWDRRNLQKTWKTTYAGSHRFKVRRRKVFIITIIYFSSARRLVLSPKDIQCPNYQLKVVTTFEIFYSVTAAQIDQLKAF